jgi:hypothetical protein
MTTGKSKDKIEALYSDLCGWCEKEGEEVNDHAIDFARVIDSIGDEEANILDCGSANLYRFYVKGKADGYIEKKGVALAWGYFYGLANRHFPYSHLLLTELLTYMEKYYVDSAYPVTDLEEIRAVKKEIAEEIAEALGAAYVETIERAEK